MTSFGLGVFFSTDFFRSIKVNFRRSNDVRRSNKLNRSNGLNEKDGLCLDDLPVVAADELLLS